MGGGGDVSAAFVWMHEVIAGGRSGPGGDIVVLRASGADGYDGYLAGLAPFNSVRTVLVPGGASGDDLGAAASYVDCAEGVFFAGGDQSNYARWKGSALISAVQAVYQRGGVVGGTSAGLAILGQFVYDAARGSATTAEAVGNPHHSSISFTRDMLAFPPMAGAITDSHFGARDRFGRLAAFMARQIADGVVTRSPPQVLGIGVDEATAIVVDSAGMGTIRGSGSAYLVRGGAATRVAAGMPLVYPGLTVTRLGATAHSFDFGRWCGTGPTYTVSVDGSSPQIYAPAPYDVPGPAGTCP